MRKIITVFIILIFILIAAWFYKSYKMVPELPAYDHDLISENGTAVKISDFNGQYVLISYFQTWCGSCIRELPEIDALQQKVGKDKLSVFIVSDEPLPKVLHFKEKYCNTLDYYTTHPFPHLGIRVFPTTYLLNKDGEVILSKLDYFNWNTEEVVKLITKQGQHPTPLYQPNKQLLHL
jgi:thiol-disulfide isomerase/thioredoxin